MSIIFHEPDSTHPINLHKNSSLSRSLLNTRTKRLRKLKKKLNFDFDESALKAVFEAFFSNTNKNFYFIKVFFFPSPSLITTCW